MLQTTPILNGLKQLKFIISYLLGILLLILPELLIQPPSSQSSLRLKDPKWLHLLVYYSCQSVLHYCNKIPKVINLKRGKVYFSWQFLWFQSMVGWHHCFGLGVKQYITVGVQQRKVILLMVGKHNRGKDECPTIPDTGIPPVI
jgi:hypothetical protein